MNRKKDLEVDDDGLDLPASVRAQIRRFERNDADGNRDRRRRARARRHEDEWCTTERWRNDMS